MPDPKDYLFLIHDAPKKFESRELVKWLIALNAWDRVRFVDAKQRFEDCQHNAGIADALNTRFDKFVFIESDIRPGAKTAPFWEAEADVVGCRYPTENEHAWDNPHVIHAGLYRTHRKVLETIREQDPPCFSWIFDRQRTKVVQCLCKTFCQKVRKFGFTICQAGEADHRPKR